LKIKHGLVATGLIAALATPASAAKLDDLAWMKGTWVGHSKTVRAEEHWTAPAGGLMLCMHRDVVEGHRTSFEFLRIVERGDSIVFIAMPNARNETPFPLKTLAGKRVVFENPEHDYPQRIIYWQDKPGMLGARTEGTINGKLESEEFSWTKGELGK
jgi:hypothetical protein